jgi:hypothetical protein
MSQVRVNTIVDANSGNTAQINGMTPTADSLQGFRNRILNGDMRIDQRNAGAAVTTNASFPVDRFIVSNTTDGAFSAQQDSSAPAEFVNSVKITITTADTSVTTTQILSYNQNIEGFSIADLGWGTANAKPVTLSFWVRSSLTGTFGGAFRNAAANRSYPFTYTISAADTWEYKTITVEGDTTGTWPTDNSGSMRCAFALGSGPDRNGPAGAWNSNNNISTTGAVSVIGTLNATFYITGVQLEAGSVATPFERRPYGTELALCQRYFQAIPVETYSYAGGTFSATDARTTIPLIVSMRAAPTGITTTGTIQFATSAGAGTGAIAFSKGTASAVTVVSSGASGLPSAGGCSLLRSSSGVERLQVSVEL